MAGDGNRIIMSSSPGDGDEYTSDPGLVRAFEYSSSSWSQIGQTLSGQKNYNDQYEAFGAGGLAMNYAGDRIVVGDWGWTYSGGSPDDGGIAYVFEYNGTSWTQLGNTLSTFSPDTNLQMDRFTRYDGASINNDGDRIAIGSYISEPDSTSSQGGVWVFELSGSVWQRIGAPIAGNTGAIQIGRSVHLNGAGDRLVAGTDFGDGNGGAYVYFLTGSSLADYEWVQIGDEISNEGSSSEYTTTGRINDAGNIVTVAARLNEEVYTHFLTGSDYSDYGWRSHLMSDVLDTTNGNHHGLVAINGTGDTVVWGNDIYDTVDVGTAYTVCTLTGTDASNYGYTEGLPITNTGIWASNVHAGDYDRSYIDMNAAGDRFVVGCSLAGKSYVLQLST